MEAILLSVQAVRQPDSNDPLDNTAVLKDLLGDALPALKMFHVKLFDEGVLRGIIGPGETDVIWERHILNSAAVVPFIREFTDESRHNRVADVGSGGGFPGLVVAACEPEVDVTLIEPNQRRVNWLEECIALMGLKNVRVLRARAEEASGLIHSSRLRPFDVVTCRAVAPMRKLAGMTLPLVVPGGRLVALKGRSASVELDHAQKQIHDNKGVQPVVQLADVAPGLEPTHVIIIEKHKR